MPLKIGVPRGMYYYKHYPFTETFLTELGAELVLSPETNKEVLDYGVRYSIDDACLPVKVYHGHAYKLRDQVDFILIPRLTSISKKEYICPKFGGLPEMVKYSVPHMPPVIDIEVNMHKSEKAIRKALFALAHNLKVKNPIKIGKALRSAVDAHNRFNAALIKGNTPDQVLKKQNLHRPTTQYTVGIVGHPYLLYDSFINMKLLNKLKEWGIGYITPEMVDPHIINERCNELPKRMFWSSGKTLIGSALYFMDNSKIDGLLLITAFGCGIDSLTGEYIENTVRKTYKRPFIVLSLDEHTGDAGYTTRLEAFKNLLEWRSQHGSNLSPYGRSLHSS